MTTDVFAATQDANPLSLFLAVALFADRLADLAATTYNRPHSTVLHDVTRLPAEAIYTTQGETNE